MKVGFNKGKKRLTEEQKSLIYKLYEERVEKIKVDRLYSTSKIIFLKFHKVYTDGNYSNNQIFDS
ncbi:MAG TPA: hypothetical protein EYG74_06120 [Sulfurimonas autotrophica]|nr:hypothetical protein [Sulfurimonas autotrophica]